MSSRAKDIRQEVGEIDGEESDGDDDEDDGGGDLNDNGDEADDLDGDGDGVEDDERQEAAPCAECAHVVNISPRGVAISVLSEIFKVLFL